jgi:predicted nuclease with TOPRIM domain
MGDHHRDEVALEEENAVLQQELIQASEQRTLDVHSLQQQMADIASQNQRLAHMLHDQSETIQQLHTDAEETEDNVDAGNQELQQAVRSEMNSPAAAAAATIVAAARAVCPATNRLLAVLAAAIHTAFATWLSRC